MANQLETVHRTLMRRNINLNQFCLYLFLFCIIHYL